MSSSDLYIMEIKEIKRKQKIQDEAHHLGDNNCTCLISPMFLPLTKSLWFGKIVLGSELLTSKSIRLSFSDNFTNHNIKDKRFLLIPQWLGVEPVK